MKITIEPEEGEKILTEDRKPLKPVVYEHVFDFCLTGRRADQLGVVSIRRLHSNPRDVFGLVGLLEAAKQELLANARQHPPHYHDPDKAIVDGVVPDVTMPQAG